MKPQADFLIREALDLLTGWCDPTVPLHVRVESAIKYLNQALSIEQGADIQWHGRSSSA